MKVFIEHLINLWDSNDLDSLSLKMDAAAFKTAQVFSLNEKAGISVQTDCTKDYILSLKEKSPYAFVKFKKDLVSLLKKHYGEDYPGIYIQTNLSALIRLLEIYKELNENSPIKRKVFALTSRSNDKEDYIVESEEITLGKAKTAIKALNDGEIEYRLSAEGCILVTSNKPEQMRVKWTTLRFISDICPVKGQIALGAVDEEALSKTEAVAIKNTYKSSPTPVIVFAGSVSRYAEKELEVFDPSVRIIRVWDESIFTNEDSSNLFLNELSTAIKGDLQKAIDGEEKKVEKKSDDKLDEKEKASIISKIKNLEADYSHKKYIDLLYDFLFDYGKDRTGAFISQIEKIKEQKELMENKF